MQDRREGVREEGKLSFYLQQQLVATSKKAFLQLSAVLKNATLYPPAHPFLLGSAEQLLVALEDIFSKRGEAAFNILAGELFFETFSVPIEEGMARQLEEFSRKDIGGVVFKPGLRREEIVSFAYLMNRDVKTTAVQGGMAALLGQSGIAHISLQRALPAGEREDQKREASHQKPSEIFMDAVDTVKDMMNSAQYGKMLNVRRMQTVVHKMVDSILDNRDALLGLSTIKMYDEYTFAHSVNVSILCIAMGVFLSFEKSMVSTLGMAGMLHDIGKVLIPHEIIGKPGALTDDEWEVVKYHPIDGALMLAGLPGVSKLVMVSSFEHHQHYDFRGYPMKAETAHQHPFSRIVAIADAYDALTAMRVYYHIATPPDEAARILLTKRGGAFDPVLVKAFVNLIGLFPIGTVLKLNTGEVGLVVHQTRDLMRPRVLALNRYDGTDKEEVSLLETEMGKYKRSVVGTINPNVAKINVQQYLM